MSKPIISVIISVYNHESYVEELIHSVVHQDYGYESIELIVMDDCSKDNSALVLTALANQYNFELILNQENKGICRNINHALTLAHGKYICLTGSDDIWVLSKLSKQVAYMESHSTAAVCSGNVTRINKDGDKLPTDKQISAPARIYSFKDIFLRDFPFSSTCAMIRKDVFETVGHYDEACKIEDYYMWLKIAYKGMEIHFIEDILGYYRLHDSNTILKSWLIYSEMWKIINVYKTHDLYFQAARRLKIVYFPQIAQIDKKKALGLLPLAISNTRFFYRGMYYLLTPLKR